MANISAEDAIALGASGPTLRGSGVDFDLRRDAPYSGYENFKFKVPLGSQGDVFDRYMCRVQDYASRSASCGRPRWHAGEGPIKVRAPKVVLPDRENMKTEMESLDLSLQDHYRRFSSRPGARFTRRSQSPRGEMGYYVVSDGTAKPYRVHMRAGLPRESATIPKMCEGGLIADVVAAIIGSIIDIVLGEIDR